MSRKKREDLSMKDQLCDFRRTSQSQCADLFFEVDGKEFDLHCVVLSAKMGDYITSHRRTGRKMHGSGLKFSERITIEDFPGGNSCFEQIAIYCYEESSFTIQLENSPSLYYASRYLLMLGEENLFETVKRFVGEVILNEAAKITDIVRFYQASRYVEEQHNIPNDLSSQAWTHLNLKSRIKDDPEKLLSVFVKEFNETLAKAIVSMKYCGNDKQASDFLIDLIVRLQKSCNSLAKRQKTVAQCDKAKKTTVAERIEGMKILLKHIHPGMKKILDVMQLDDELFSLVEGGKAGMLGRFLEHLKNANSLKTMSLNSLEQLLKHCTSLLLITSGKKGSSKAKSKSHERYSLSEPDISLFTGLLCKILPAVSLRMKHMNGQNNRELMNTMHDNLHQWERFRGEMLDMARYYQSYMHDSSFEQIITQLMQKMPDSYSMKGQKSNRK